MTYHDSSDNFEILALNGITGDCLTTDDLEPKTYEDCLNFAEEHLKEFHEYASAEDAVTAAIDEVSLAGYASNDWNAVYAQLDSNASYYWTPLP
jgi:hypothetical protein